MRSIVIMAALALFAACDQGEEADDLIFKEGSRFNRAKFIAGMKAGCKEKNVETVAYFDRKKYCDCMADYVLANAGNITLKTTSSNEKEVSIDLVSHFESGEGASEVSKCRLEAIDESKFDWTAEEKRFKAAFATKDTAEAAVSKHAAYLDCVWSQLSKRFGPKELIEPGFEESPVLKALRDSCAKSVGYEIPE
jgi:hypothetical protein